MRNVPPWLVGEARRQFPTYCEEALREIVFHADVYWPPSEGWGSAPRWRVDNAMRAGHKEALHRGAITLPEGY